MLDLMHTEIAIKEIKDHFEDELSLALNLIEISAPLLVSDNKGINDNLTDVERTVSFHALDIQNTQLEIVQSLAKWKRMALTRYGFVVGEGLYTNMHTI